ITYRFDDVSMPTPIMAQGVNVARALVPETKILTHQQPTSLQAMHQKALNKCGCRHVGKCLVEALENDLFNAQTTDIPDFVAQTTDLCGYEFRSLSALSEESARVGLESEYGGSELKVGCSLADPPEYGLMAQVHPIEIADGDCAGPVRVMAREGSVDSQRGVHTREFTILDCLILEASLCLPQVLARAAWSYSFPAAAQT